MQILYLIPQRNKHTHTYTGTEITTQPGWSGTVCHCDPNDLSIRLSSLRAYVKTVCPSHKHIHGCAHANACMSVHIAPYFPLHVCCQLFVSLKVRKISVVDCNAFSTGARRVAFTCSLSPATMLLCIAFCCTYSTVSVFVCRTE